jgi:heat-inducible transcriptional repressor
MIKRQSEIDERSREMLALLIRTHVTTGEPVGSRTISRMSSEGLSSATVRNIIADLEEAGFLEQPHTSAGRVPSDKGYRFYVDHITGTARRAGSGELDERGSTDVSRVTPSVSIFPERGDRHIPEHRLRHH